MVCSLQVVWFGAGTHSDWTESVAVVESSVAERAVVTHPGPADQYHGPVSQIADRMQRSKSALDVDRSRPVDGRLLGEFARDSEQ